MDRRTFMGIGAGLAGAATLAACGGGGGTRAASANGKQATLPDFIAPKSLPGELNSPVPDVLPAFDRYPAAPYTSVSSPPGAGGDVTTMQINFSSPPPGLAANRWQQEVNRRLNANVQATLVTDADLAQKTQTFIASGDIPDLFYVNIQKVPAALSAVLQGAFVDLSKHIGGSKSKQYPNLAALPTLTWKNSAINGGLYGVPVPVPVVNTGLPLYRADWQRKLGIAQPTNSTEAFDLFSAFANGDPTGTGKKDSWTFGEISPWDQEIVLTMFGVPNNWRRNADGTLTKDIETDEYQAALEFLVKLWKAGGFHPNAVSNTYNQAQDLWTGGSTAIFGGPMLASLTFLRGNPIKGVADMVGDIKPFLPPGQRGGKPGYYQTSGNFGMYTIPSKVKDEKRIQELLRILDFFAGPFGSAEYTLFNYGIEGHNYTVVDGVPTPSTNVAVQAEMATSFVPTPAQASIYIPGPPSQSTTVQKYFEQVMPSSIADPTINLVSSTRVVKGASLDQILHDGFIDIVSGRQPLSSLDSLRRRWKSQGGDSVRREFQEAV